jgi:uncharacterized protein
MPAEPATKPARVITTEQPLKTAAKSPAAPVTAAIPVPPAKPVRKKIALKIPPILLEGDKPVATSISGPGRRYALGPAATLETLESEGELPEAYGTQRLLLAARDPHWLYAHWDLTREQQQRFNALSADRHLVVRVYMDAISGRAVTEVHVHPESRHWFIHVERAGTRYAAELGYYDRHRAWTRISISSPTLAPPETLSPDTSSEFATIPFELPLSKLVSLVKEAVREYLPLAEALNELRDEGHPALPPQLPPPAPWTPAQERALAEVLSMDPVHRVWMGSMEITELIRRQFAQEMASLAAAQLEAPTSPAFAPGGISSPVRAVEAPRGFWFNVNAELIVYGATEADATVTIGGRMIRLRPDGSFSYRFALPDGEYELPVVAVSADRGDGRAAELRFSRGTRLHGHVSAHPQDANLKAPLAQNIPQAR